MGRTAVIRDFNINDYVHVKLTDRGRELLKEEGLFKSYKEDLEGWSKFQLHDLMNIFGQDMFLGNPDLPFETGIRVEFT